MTLRRRPGSHGSDADADVLDDPISPTAALQQGPPPPGQRARKDAPAPAPAPALSLSLAAFLAAALSAAFALGAASAVAAIGALRAAPGGAPWETKSALAFRGGVALDAGNASASVAQRWSAALNAHDVGAISALYADDALLYATFSTVLGTRRDIAHYFAKLFERELLSVSLNSLSSRPHGGGDGSGSCSGLYTFSYVERNGSTISVTTIPARYSFTYESRAPGRDTRILEHHSSVDPELHMAVTPVETHARVV
jgi:hypothetical protein